MKKTAFTLIELLIVILIIGIIYTLAVTNFQNISKSEQKLTLATLKSYLQSFPHTKSVRFLCLDDCSSCNILVDNEVIKELDGVFDNFIDDTIKVYRYSVLDGYVEKNQGVYFNSENMQEDICFSYSIDKNGIGEQVLVEFNEKFYDFSPYFTPSIIYNSIEDAREAKEKLNTEVSD